jgi:hypothetical protein
MPRLGRIQIIARVGVLHISVYICVKKIGPLSPIGRAKKMRDFAPRLLQNTTHLPELGSKAFLLDVSVR